MTLRDTTAALAKGELTATEHVRQVLADLDALDGTPLVDIKPHLPTIDLPPA